MMKFTACVLAASAATVQAGSCCCGACLLGFCTSYSDQCGVYGDSDDVIVTKSYLDSDTCDGSPIVTTNDVTVYGSTCSDYSGYDEADCSSSCTWNSATSTTLAATAAVVGLVVYAM